MGSDLAKFGRACPKHTRQTPIVPRFPFQAHVRADLHDDGDDDNALRHVPLKVFSLVMSDGRATQDVKNV